MKTAILSITMLCLAFLPMFAQETKRPAESVKVERAVAPAYPDFAMLTRIAGVVKVQVEINADGKVVTVKGSGQENLLLAAKSAALKWEFERSRITKLRTLFLTFKFILPPEDKESTGPKVSFEPPYTIQIEGEKVCITQNKSIDP